VKEAVRECLLAYFTADLNQLSNKLADTTVEDFLPVEVILGRGRGFLCFSRVLTCDSCTGRYCRARISYANSVCLCVATRYQFKSEFSLKYAGETKTTCVWN